MSEVETPEVEADADILENPLAGLVDAALAKDYNKANEIFGQAISVKLDDVMDQERIKLANSIYNGDEDEEDMEDSEDVSDDDVDVEDSDDENDNEDDEDSDLEDS